jgi:8-oxo-(d)GTP phosphatase
VAVLLIRHAHAGSRKDWDGDDRLRPLSDKGRRQATVLARHLKLWTPKRILSSPYLRCVESVEPYAKSLGVKVEEVEELAEGSGDGAMALIRRLPSYDVALCSHGDIISTVLSCVVNEDHLDLGRSPRSAKGSTWVLEKRGRRIQKVTYRQPPR